MTPQLTTILVSVILLLGANYVNAAYDSRGKSSRNANDELHQYNNRNLKVTPSKLPPAEQTLSTGLFHTCAITRRAGVDQESCGANGCGPVKCWGANDKEQSTPPPGVMFTQISAGGFFTCGLKVGGKVVCWGDIDHPPRSLEMLEESMSGDKLSEFRQSRRLQELANGQNNQMKGGGYYTQVSSGMKHVCAITRGMEVQCWGRNDYGESSPPSGSFVQVRIGVLLC